MPSRDEGLERCRRAKRHHRNVGVFGVRHEGHVRRHNANPTALRRRCGRRVSDDGSIVPNERDQRAPERKGAAHGVEADLLPRELVCGTSRSSPRARSRLVLSHAARLRPAGDTAPAADLSALTHQIREPLAGRGERRPKRRDIARRVHPQPVACGHFIEDECAAAHQRVEHARRPPR